MFRVVGLASRLICQAGWKCALPPEVCCFKSNRLPHFLCYKAESLLCSVILAFQDAEKGCFECTKCTPKLLLNAAIEIEGFRVKS